MFWETFPTSGSEYCKKYIHVVLMHRLVNTVKILDNKKNEGAGKKFIVAEADAQQEIDADWAILEKQVTELPSKTFESFAKLQVYLKNPPAPKQQQVSNKQLVVSQKIEIQEDCMIL